MAKTLPFGKYKGRTIAEVASGDPEYLRWLCAQDGFRNQDIIDGVEGLMDAPMRRAMQARFQDVNFCRRFLQVSGHEAILLHELEARHARAREQITDRLRELKEMTSKAKNYTDAAWAQTHGIFPDPMDRERQIAGFEQMITTLHELRRRIPNRIEAPEPKISCRFEQHGFDVIMRASIRYPWESKLRENYLGFQDGGIKRTVAIKIRGTISPATVRWISENRNRADHVVLLAGGPVEEAVAANIKVVFTTELDRVAARRWIGD